jgi:CRP-like cAMP-binding protein
MEAFKALTRVSKVVNFKLSKRLLRQDEPVKFVYFPLTCMVSVLVTEKTMPSLEMATIGKEGVVGASELIQNQGAIGLSIIQLPGTALQIEAAAFIEIANRHPNVKDLMNRHLFALLRQALYDAACNRLHSMEERCARWLLMTHDRALTDEFPLTQDFLAHMLGVRRATVNVATGMLRKAGFIRYARGRITIVDRPGLESAACHCYADIVKAYKAILP